MKKWYQLVGPNGYLASPTKVVLGNDADVDDLRTAVWKENQNKLKYVSSARLRVYKDKESFEKQEAYLNEDAAIGAWGCSKNEALWIAVPASQAAVSEGALRLSVDCLTVRFGKATKLSETALLQHFLSNDLLPYMGRCFGNTHSTPIIGNDFKMFLKKIMVNEKQSLNILTNQQDIDSYSSLKKAGILVELPNKTLEFTSQLAKRYYFKWVFPNRSLTSPSTLVDLIKNAVSSMSATTLKNSTSAEDFPKEAVFQHLFMEGLALYTPPDCCICPELSKIFPPDSNLITPHRIAGEIDFYINSTYSSLRWGIELLVNGGGIGEHVSRFTPPHGNTYRLPLMTTPLLIFVEILPVNQQTFQNTQNEFLCFLSRVTTQLHCVFLVKIRILLRLASRLE